MGLSIGLGQAFDVAARNHHLVATADLRASGLDGPQITALVRDGVLERIARGLYRIAGTRTILQDVAAALSRHQQAVASHTTALHLHDIEGRPPARPHLTLPPGSTGHTSLGQLHRSPLAVPDVTLRYGLPTVTLARAVVDAAEQLSEERLTSVLNEVISGGRTTVVHIGEAAQRVEDNPGRVGLGRLRRALRPWTEALRPDSVAEAAAIRRIVGYGLPTPVTQFVALDDEGVFVARLDLAWPDRLVAREYDSVRFHGPDRIEADEVRRQRLEDLGWVVDSVQRQHLVPSRTDWLRSLARDLDTRRRLAS